jgi:amino acid permease
MILSDTLPSLASSFLGYTITRTQALLGVTLVALLPLCLMKSLKALAPFSLVGIIGMIYTSCAMALRFFDQSYGPGGRFLETLGEELAPQFAEPQTLKGLVFNSNIFLLVSMLSTAFMSHYNAHKFYWELENNTLPRYQLVVNVSFAISMLLFIAVGSFGFATFGKSCSGVVLNNYSTKDELMSLSRIAVALSLLFSYPLAFVGVREGILDLLQVDKRSDRLLNNVTVGLLAVITMFAYKLRDLRKLLAFSGATWGNAVIYLMPTYMFVQCANKLNPELKPEVPRAVITGILGLIMGIIGTVKAIES